MTSMRYLVAAAIVSTGIATAAPSSAAQAAAAAKASPELVNDLSSAMSATPDQAAAAAGILFGVAKSRLKPNEFGQVAKAVPGMDALLKAAPAAGGGAAGALSQLSGSAGTLAGAAAAFSKLGLSPDLVNKAVGVITSFVSKSGGANVGSLLASALK